MNVFVERLTSDGAVVRPGGKLRGSAARFFASVLEGLRNTGVSRVVLDLSSCDSMDAIGASALAEFIAGGVRAVFLRVAPSLRRDLAAGGLSICGTDLAISEAEACLAIGISPLPAPVRLAG